MDLVIDGRWCTRARLIAKPSKTRLDRPVAPLAKTITLETIASKHVVLQLVRQRSDAQSLGPQFRQPMPFLALELIVCVHGNILS